MRSGLAILLVVGCRADPVAPPKNTIVEPPKRAATAWQTTCLAALKELRKAATVYEPGLWSARVELDDLREGVTFSAFPPVQDVSSIHIFVVHETKPETMEWQRYNEPMNGLDHITWLRATPMVHASILLDGWETASARRLEPTLVAGVEPCL